MQLDHYTTSYSSVADMLLLLAQPPVIAAFYLGLGLLGAALA